MKNPTWLSATIFTLMLFVLCESPTQNTDELVDIAGSWGFVSPISGITIQLTFSKDSTYTISQTMATVSGEFYHEAGTYSVTPTTIIMKQDSCLNMQEKIQCTTTSIESFSKDTLTMLFQLATWNFKRK